MNSKNWIKSISAFLIIGLLFVPVFSQNNYENWSNEVDNFLALGEFDQALELVNSMIKAKSKKEVWDEVIFGELKKAELFKLTSKRKQRLIHAQRAIDITKQYFPDDDVLKALSYTELGRAHWRMGNVSLAIQNLEKGKDYMASLEGWDRYVGILCDFAAIYFEQEELEKAEKIIEEAYQAAQTYLEEDDYHYGDIYNWKQKLSFKKGDYESSLRSLNEAMKFTGIAKKKANIHFNIAAIHRMKGDHDRALNYYFQALTITQALNFPDTLFLVDIHNKIGDVNSQKGNYDEAILNIGKAIDYLKSLSRTGLEATYIAVYNNLAFARMGKSVNQEVIPLLQEALKFHKKAPAAKEITLQNISRAYRLKSQYNQARIYQNQAIEAHRKLYGDNHPEIEKGYRHLGWMDAQEKKWPSALAYYQKALGIIALDFEVENDYSNPPISSVENLTQFYYILQNKGIALKNLGEEKQDEELLKASLETYELTANVVDNMLDNYQEGSKQFWIATIRPIYEQALGVAAGLYKMNGKAEYLEKAFYFAERGRAVLLRESLKESVAKQQGLLDPKALEMEKEIKINLAFYRKQIFQEESKKTTADTSKILAWRSNIFNLNQQWDSIKTNLNSVEGNEINHFENKTIFSLSEVQKNIVDSTLLLEYVLGDSMAFILAIDNQSVKLTSIPKEVLQTLIPFIKQIKDRDEVTENGLAIDFFQKYQLDAKKLYDLLIKPTLLPSYKNLIIIPDGILGYLPFETLVQTLILLLISPIIEKYHSF